MITLYFTNINNLVGDIAFGNLLDKIDANTKEKIAAYRSPQQQLSILCGRFLLDKLLSVCNLDNNLSIHDLQYNQWGKPYFNGDFDFSIAHSGDIVICAGVIGAKIGADVEIEEPRDISSMQDYFTADEWTEISGAETSTSFYRAWVRKEACIKAVGKGLFQPLSGIDVREESVMLDDSKWFFHDLHIQEGYTASLVTNRQNESVIMKEINIDTLINQE